MRRLFFVFILIFTSVSLHAYAKKIILVSFSTEQRAKSMMEELPELSPSLFALAKEHSFEVKMRKSGKYFIITAEVFTDKKVLNEALTEIRKRFKGVYVNNYTYPSTDAPQKEKTEVEKVEVVEKSAIIEEQKEEVVVVVEESPIIEELKEEEVVVENKDVEENKIDNLETEILEDEKIVEEIIEKETIVAVDSPLDIAVKEETIESIEKKEHQAENKIIERKEKEETILEKMVRIFMSHFEWLHLVIIVLVIVIVRYYIKFKRIYDQY